MAPTWYPYAVAKAPVFIQQSSLDIGFASLHDQLPVADPVNPDVVAWHEQVLSSFEVARVSWLFSGNQPYHEAAGNDDGLRLGPPGDELRDVLGRFLVGAPPEQVLF